MGPVATTTISCALGLAGFLAGAVAGRQLSGRKLRRQLNGNAKWMTKQERELAAALISSGHGHLFAGWPKPGVKDGAKRALLTAAHSYLNDGVPTMEVTRLRALQPPVADKQPKVLEAHGDIRSDPYYWLRDDKRQDRAVLGHLKAENAFTQAIMADTQPLQEELYKEMRGRIQEADQSVPVRYSGYYYYTRTLEGQQYKVHCRRRVPPGAGAPSEAEVMDESLPEEILLDENQRKIDGKHTFYMVGSVEASPDGKLLAWSEDTQGAERYTLRVKDLATGQELIDPIRQTDGSVEWAADNQHLFFVTMDHQWRPYKVWRHKLGQSGHVAVFEEEDEAFYIGLNKSRSEQLLFISCSSAVTSETRYIYADQPTSDFTLVLPRVNDVQYDVYHHGAHLLLMLRDASRPNSEVLRLSLADLEARHKALAEAAAAAAAAAAEAAAAADAAADAVAGAAAGVAADGPTGAAKKGEAKATEAAEVVGDAEAASGVAAASGPAALAPIATWAPPAAAAPAVPLPRLTVLLPHSPEVKLESLLVCSGYAVLLKRQGGLQRASVHILPPASKGGVGALEEGGLAQGGKEVSFEEPAYSLGAGAQGDFDSPIARLTYTSLTTPNSTIDYNMATGARATKKVHPVLGGFKQEQYETERQWATSHDGVKVPISIVYKKGLVKLDGSAPMLLDGYGSYEICNDTWFSANRLCLLDRGFVFAIAHVRGGGEMGRAWYEDGKYLKKKNTFLDFIASAEFLIKGKYTSPSRLAINGASAGGMLIGAVCNMRPDLFHAAVLGVPFVDCITTISDESIPLTVIEWEEWGNPNQADYYHYIKSYAPVDNVRNELYPHMLVMGGLHDPRVGYWEPAKLVARLRDQAQPGNMLMLKVEMGSGHFSVTGRFERLREEAFEYAFLLKALSMPRGVLKEDAKA